MNIYAQNINGNNSAVKYKAEKTNHLNVNFSGLRFSNPKEEFIKLTEQNKEIKTSNSHKKGIITALAAGIGILTSYKPNSDFFNSLVDLAKKKLKGREIPVEKTTKEKEPEENSTQTNESVNSVKETSLSAPVDYSDTEEFAIYFENKIREMLKDRSPENIQDIINNVCQKTGVDEKTAGEVLEGLSQFSSYSQLNVMKEALEKNEAGDIYVPIGSDLCVNDALRYITKNKQQIELDCRYTKFAMFLDDIVLDFLQKTKEKSPVTFQKFMDRVYNGEIILMQVSGWNTKINGKNVSQGLFGHETELEDAAIAVAKQIKKTGKSVDEVLNGDFTKRAKSIFGDSVDIVKLENKKGSTPNAVSDTLRSLYPSANIINAVIDTIIEEQMPIENYTIKEIEKAEELLAKYFDFMISCDSVDTINETLKNKYAEIEKLVKKQGKTMDDVYYLIPEVGKSYDLITYQYLKSNGVSPKRVLYYDGEYSPPVNLDNKVLVILDDIVGSGCSMVHQCFKYRYFVTNRFIKNTNVIFSPINCLKSGYDNVYKEFEKANRTNTDFLYPGVIVDYSKFSSSLSDEENNLLSKLLGNFGYNHGCACTALPYMLPDNNTFASGLLLEYFINNVTGNKSATWYYSMHKTVEEKLDLI